MADESMEEGSPVNTEPPDAGEPLIALSEYWKLDAWHQGHVAALEANNEQSRVKGQVNPYQQNSDNGAEWRAGHLSGQQGGQACR